MRCAVRNLAPPFAGSTRPYVIDFYCASAGLAVELDGDEHATRARRDSIRTRFLNRRGIRVIRFSNRDVCSNLDGVKDDCTCTNSSP
jgi:very-short-patch-repair endonuclease